MKVDVIIILQNGVITKHHVIKQESTAEKFFDDIAKSFLKDDYSEIEVSDDYGFKLTRLNEMIQPLGHEVIWLSRTKIKTF